MTLQENLADRLTGGKLTEQAAMITDLQETNRETAVSLAIIKESMQRLEQTLYSPEWRAMTMQGEQEFTREGIRAITNIARIMRIKNPLIKRGVKILRLYVWAQGVSIAAADEEINATIQAFMDDERNQADFSSHQARGDRETDLQSDGNLFFRYFINHNNGRVRVRTVDPNEIDDIITNPEDKREPWFYRRSYTQTALDGTASVLTEYYPDWRFLPISKTGFTSVVAASGGLGGKIIWDTPVMHILVNRLGKWGICEYYDANDWAIAYKSFLEQLASVWSALARWSAKLTTKGGRRGVAAAKTKLNTTLVSGAETNPSPVSGSMFISGDGVDLQPFRTAGATMSADDGRRLQLMAAMAFGFPETFWGDTKAGSLATAKSLDRPTELQVVDRQTLWRDIHQSVFQLVLLWAVKAPKGALRHLGHVEIERDGNQILERVVWNEGVDGSVRISFPPVIEHDISETIKALTDAQTLAGRAEGAGVPLETAVSEMLVALGLENVDEIMTIWREARENAPEAADVPEQLMGDPRPEDKMNSDDEDVAIDDMAMEAVWDRQVQAVTELLTDIRETMGVNGVSDI